MKRNLLGFAIIAISLAFVTSAGAQSIYSIQHDGTTGDVTIQGIVFGTDIFSDTWIADAAGAYNGVFIYDTEMSTTYVVGDEITVTASAEEYFTMTEIGNVSSHSLVSSGNTPYAAAVVTCTDMDKTTAADTLPAEQYEGCLVKLVNVECMTAPDGNYESDVSDDGGTHNVIIDDDANYHMDFGMTVGLNYDITGVVMYKYDVYKVCPRDNTSDIVTSSIDNWKEY